MNATPPGWYPDPTDPQRWAWWDGVRWTAPPPPTDPVPGYGAPSPLQPQPQLQQHPQPSASAVSGSERRLLKRVGKSMPGRQLSGAAMARSGMHPLVGFLLSFVVPLTLLTVAVWFVVGEIVILLPGALLLALCASVNDTWVSPRRLLVSAPGTLHVGKQSLLNGRFRPLAEIPTPPAQPPVRVADSGVLGWAQVHVGGTPMWLTTKHLDRLRRTGVA